MIQSRPFYFVEIFHLNFKHRDRDWDPKSLKLETDTETEIWKVSNSRPIPRMKSLNDETVTETQNYSHFLNTVNETRIILNANGTFFIHKSHKSNTWVYIFHISFKPVLFL